MPPSQEVILFSPLPVEACRSRLGDATLPTHDSRVAGRVRGRTVELWRRQSVLRLFQPTLAIRLFEAGERTRLETQVRITDSGLYSLLTFAATMFVVASVSITIALTLVVLAAPILAILRFRKGRSARIDGPFLREQLEHLVHATAPAD